VRVKEPGLVLCDRNVGFRGECYMCDRLFVLAIMVCEKLDNPLEQVLAGTLSHLTARSSLDCCGKVVRGELMGF
jgi:hypothetical protein